MLYKEQFVSRLVVSANKCVYKIKKNIKKVKKIWLARKEYFSFEYLMKKYKKDVKDQSHAVKNVYNESIKINDNKHNEFTEKLAVYTCVFGDYDKIKEPLFQSKYCDYYIITDQYISPKSAWKKIEPLTYPEGFDKWNPSVKNRYFKMHPQDVFETYEYSMYIDGNIVPLADLYPFLINLKRENKIIGMFKHPIFDCLYNAAKHLISIDLVDSNMMENQVSNYIREGFPEKFGFCECNLILRRHMDEMCRLIMDTWWSEYCTGVKRDQQSFTYSLWKNGLSFSDVCLFGKNIRENSRIKLIGHKRIHEKVIQNIRN